MKNFLRARRGTFENPFSLSSKMGFVWYVRALIIGILLLLTIKLQAQSIAGSTWDLSTSTASSGYTNWGSGVISLTDTTTGSGSCQGAAVTETSGYNPASNFSQCFKIFFGCPGNDQIGTLDPGGCPSCPYTDQNGDGMAFSFWKNNATYTATNGNTCGGGLGYDNALTGGANDGKMITIEFDTYSSLGTSTVDGSYGGGPPGSGVNDEISVHKDQNSNDAGLINAAGTVNAGNLEDGLEHDVCITYNAASHLLTVTIDGVPKLSYDLGATYNLNTYFGGSMLNYTWSAGKYGANNLQTLGPAGTSIFATIGHNPCTNAVLPVRLVSFTGKRLNATTVLDWSTATEINNKKFIIERSQDALNWQSIGDVAGSGNETSIRNYSFTDDIPLDGIAYYRLKQIDTDGLFTYTKIVAIENTSLNQDILIMPNPFHDAFTIHSEASGNMTIEIHDLLGRLLYYVNCENTGSALMIRPELPCGAYVITLQTDTRVEQKKIIKK